MWKAQNASRFSTPPTATAAGRYLPLLLRYTNHLAGKKGRADRCAVEQADYQRYLLRITEQESLDRERRATEWRIRQAKFPLVKTMDSFDFLACRR